MTNCVWSGQFGFLIHFVKLYVLKIKMKKSLALKRIRTAAANILLKHANKLHSAAKVFTDLPCGIDEI